MALSKIRRYAYRRYLPHLQNGCLPVFVSMATHRQWVLPPAARSIVLEHILREHEHRVTLHATVVMPDHAHLLFSAHVDQNRDVFTMAEIMNGIRGASAHRINRILKRHGPVWEGEFFDHVPRSGEFEEELMYICENPVKAGLVANWEDYPWLWLHPML